MRSSTFLRSFPSNAFNSSSLKFLRSGGIGGGGTANGAINGKGGGGINGGGIPIKFGVFMKLGRDAVGPVTENKNEMKMNFYTDDSTVEYYK